MDSSADARELTSLEDIFNMDMLAGPSTHSPSLSYSPSDTFSTLPPTPPQPMISDPMLEDASFFSFAMLEPEAFAKSAASATPYDFFAAFPDFASTSNESSPASAISPHNLLAIDPQLVDSPSAPEADDHDDAELGDEDDDEDDENTPAVTIKVGGRGKARKGTVQSGGIVKKIQKREPSEEPEDWRPSPEEYKKLSSKEKRQLRNKISARNFRIRRKEYITTLEGDIAERDRLLDAVRSELGSTKDENAALRQEVAALKKALLEGNEEGPVLPPPAPLPAISAAITATKRPSSPPRPNTHKDLPSSPRLASQRAFWGGCTSPMSFGGFTPVHTTLIPDFPSAKAQALQENLNPALNSSAVPFAKAGGVPAPGFDAFTEMNPFTLKTLDAYRMQLWQKMAAQQHARNQLQMQQQQPAALNGLAASLKPAFFATKPVSSALLAGKSAVAPYPTRPEVVAEAALASQTFVQRLGSAFFDAFAGRAGPGTVDADKMRRVLEGKAVLRVVDVDAPRMPSPAQLRTPAPARECADICSILEESMRSLTISKKGQV